MKSPFFSLAVVTYNSELTLNETLASLTQLEGLEVVELILADDASTDGTRVLITEWLDTNSWRFAGIRTVFQATNRGISATHTAAFSGATGLWGLYLGGDDLISRKDFFPALQRLLERAVGQLYRTKVLEYHSENGMLIDFSDGYRFLRRLSAGRQFRYLAGTGNPFRSGPGTLFRVETLRLLDGFGTYNRAFEDWQLFLRFTRAGHRIGFLDVEGVLWRRHRNQFSATGSERMRLANREVKRREITPFLDRLSLFERWKSRHSGRVSDRLNEVYKAYLELWGRVFS